MRTVDDDTLDWLSKAKEARAAAELLDDADAKEVMLELCLHYVRLAQSEDGSG